MRRGEWFPEMTKGKRIRCRAIHVHPGPIFYGAEANLFRFLILHDEGQRLSRGPLSIRSCLEPRGIAFPVSAKTLDVE